MDIKYTNMNNYFIVILVISTIISITSGKTFLDGKREEEDRLVYHRFIRVRYYKFTSTLLSI